MRPPLLIALALLGCAAPPVTDPTAAGPYATITVEGAFTSSASGDTVGMHAVCPDDDAGAPWPVVVFGHGFQIPPAAYEELLKRLASFGYMVIAPNYPDPLMGPVNYIHDGQNLAAGLDWAASDETLRPHADLSKAGVMGHSRGGKAAVLAALLDPRFKAVYGIDPVDSPPPASVTCDPETECPAAYPRLPGLHVPTLFVGETLDAEGGLACAPASGNFGVFFANANAPSLKVTVHGASHVSFVPDRMACGLACELCQEATAEQPAVIDLTSAYAVAFFERHLRGNTALNAWLDGDKARARFVSSGLASIEAR